VGTLSSKRKSHVEVLRDWPRGTRRRGWGILHDRVWFPRDAPRSKYPLVQQFGTEVYQLYLDRKMIWTPFGSLRLHTFYTGDDDSSVHDHPWNFITFPFRSYTETVQTVTDNGTVNLNSRVVRAWRFHFRRATHRHFVHEPLRSFSTIIITGRNKRDWSFWPDGKTRIRHAEWTSYERESER